MTRNQIQNVRDFLALRRIAVFGASRKRQHYSRMVMKELSACGVAVLPVNPLAAEIGGMRSFGHLTEIQPPPEGALLLVPVHAVVTAVEECLTAGIRHIWIRQADDSAPSFSQAAERARAAGASVVTGECPLMFLPRTAWFHRLHGAVNRLVGTYPR